MSILLFPKLESMSFILSTRPPSFLTSIKIPPPARPAKISPADIFSEIHVKAFTTVSFIRLATVEITLPTFENTLPRLPKESRANEHAFDVPSNAFAIVSLTTAKPFPFSIPSFSLMKNSPSDDVTSRTDLPNEETAPPVRKLVTGFTTAEIAFPPISKSENIPLKVVFSFAADSSLSFSRSVKSRKFLVICGSCQPLSAGNTSRNASFTGTTTLSNPSKEFLKLSISAVLPPDRFHAASKSFRAWDCWSIKPPTTWLTPVQSSFASSKSPNISSNVMAQPEPTASLSVSINWLNVFTS